MKTILLIVHQHFISRPNPIDIVTRIFLGLGTSGQNGEKRRESQVSPGEFFLLLTITIVSITSVFINSNHNCKSAENNYPKLGAILKPKKFKKAPAKKQ